MVITLVLLILQLLTLGVILFGDIGFDFPGRYGLDFDHFIVLAFFLVMLLATGLAWSWKRRKWSWAALQLVGPIAALTYGYIEPSLNDRRLDPAQFQYMVGQSKVEVRQALGKQRIHLSGSEGESQGSYTDFEVYSGMTIHYSPDGRVVSIEADPSDE